MEVFSFVPGLADDHGTLLEVSSSPCMRAKMAMWSVWVFWWQGSTRAARRQPPC